MRQLIASVLAVILSAAVFGTGYVVAQQIERTSADDAPTRLASQVAAELSSGSTQTVDAAAPVDLGRSLAPFVVVVDRSGAVTDGTATLDGTAPALPAGVIASTRAAGRDAVTWQPRDGLRFATVEVAVGSHVVIAGQSLAPSERATDKLLALIAAAWFVTALVAVGGIYLSAAWAKVLRAR
ncbi:hypothetical protein ACFPJ4_12555 [Lysinimonas soli]|uniref:Two-component sensor histidine kinase n=1 Tax=Lysinimonas soli TaxID=1074233 RepID=A0ABW0NUY7_9MICO